MAEHTKKRKRKLKIMISSSVQPGLATERAKLQSIPVTPDIADQTAHAKSYGGVISEAGRNVSSALQLGPQETNEKTVLASDYQPALVSE